MELRNKATAKLVLLGLLAAGLLYIYFGTALLPITHRARAAEIGELQERQEQLVVKLAQSRRIASTLPALEAEHGRMVKRWAQAQTLLPDETEIAALLHQIAWRGQQNGVEFTLFKPGPLTARSFYSEKPVEIRIEGGYHQIAGCLNALAQMDRIVHVHDLELEQIPPNEQPDGGGPSARAHFFVTAYVLGVAQATAEAQAEQAKDEGGLGSAVKRLVSGRKSNAQDRTARASRGGGSDE